MLAEYRLEFSEHCNCLFDSKSGVWADFFRVEGEDNMLLWDTSFNQFSSNTILSATILDPYLVTNQINVNEVTMHTLFALPPYLQQSITAMFIVKENP